MEGIAIVLGAASLVLAAALFLRGGLLGGSLAVLLAGCCLGYPLFNVPVKPVPLTLDRVLWVVLILQYAIWRQLGWTARRPLGTTEYLLSAFVLLLMASTFTHDWEVRNAQPLSRLVFYFLMPLGMYWVARQTSLGERGVLAMFAVMGLFGVYLAVTAIAEIQEAWWLVYPTYVRSKAYVDYFGRGRGPLLDPVACGFYQMAGLAGGLMWWPRVHRAGRIVLLVFAALMLAGLYATLTRTVWIGAGVGLLVLLALVLPRSWSIPIFLAGAVSAALVVVTINWEHVVSFKRDKQLSAEETGDSARLRPMLATIAWKMALDRPLLGCGFGQYPDEQAPYAADRTADLPLEKARPYPQHNALLALLTETGLVGMALYAAVLILWLRTAWRLWRSGGPKKGTVPLDDRGAVPFFGQSRPLWVRQEGLFFLVLLAFYLPNAMFHNPNLTPGLNMLLFFLAGVSEGLRAHGDPRIVAERPQDASAAGSALQLRPVV
jgi:O-antigen ligase